MIMGAKRTTSLVFCAALLGGCGGDFADLDAFMAEVRARPVGAIEPIPTFKPYQSFTYSAQSLRSPFDVPLTAKEVALQTGKVVKPDLLHAHEFLERFDIEGLAMVGTLAQEGTLWVLVKDGEGGVHRVRIGNYLGKNHGKIIGATETEISIQEIVPNGVGGWIERPRTIELTEQ
jgi:type IV pilus assembly protein PilP